ncbi:type II toxin-antitoxin system RelE/ParE family toxin [Rhizobium leguminosarum]|uniref:type II toxin-antitoxin system RelE/ParE family toxin n=1 Tax=Rhizobium leguminosarum TaxID=384 RepID=UPI003F97C24F
MKTRMELEYVNNSALKAMNDLPEEIRLQFVADLQRIQDSKNPYSDFKHLQGYSGVIELIENGGNGPGYRAVYCAKYLDTVYVLHAFTKTTNGVDRPAINTVEERHKLMMAKVRARKAEEAKASKAKGVKPKKK